MGTLEFMNESSPSNPELREATVAYRVQADEEALEFPVAPDFDPRPPQLSPADYVAWCEEVLSTFPTKPARAMTDRDERCSVEFVL